MIANRLLYDRVLYDRVFYGGKYTQPFEWHLKSYKY